MHSFSVISATANITINDISGVTRVDVTRAATDGVTLFYLEKNLRPVFSHRPLESDDLFSCRLLNTPIFPRRLSSVLFKLSYKK